jgi:hypothetical protein
LSNSRDESCGQLHEWARNTRLLPQRRGNSKAARDDVAFTFAERRHEILIWEGLDLTPLKYVQLPADLACKINMEPGKLAGLIKKVERRKVDSRDESDAGNRG